MLDDKLLRSLGWTDPAKWASALDKPCRDANINSSIRLSMFLANTGHETNGGRSLRESLDYKAEALLSMWPKRFTHEIAFQVGRTPQHKADQEAIAHIVYGGRMGNLYPGDGFKFRGGGLMQTTGRDNYGMLANVCKRPIDSIPEWLSTPEGASISATLYWSWAGCNKLADVGALEQCRKVINGGLTNIDDVRARFLKAMNLLGG